MLQIWRTLKIMLDEHLVEILGRRNDHSHIRTENVELIMEHGLYAVALCLYLNDAIVLETYISDHSAKWWYARRRKVQDIPDKKVFFETACEDYVSSKFQN